MDQTRLDAIANRQANWITAERGSIGERVWGKTLIGEDIPALLAEIERLTTALKLLESDRDAERKIRLDAEAEADAWRRRAEERSTHNG